MSLRAAEVGANPEPVTIATTGSTFQINNTKVYVLIAILSISDNRKFLENIEQRFNRTVSWNKYRSEIITKPKSNDLDYMIYPTFKNINKLFASSFKYGDNGPTRDSFDNFCMPLVEIKDFNALIHNKPFLDRSLKNKQETYKKLVQMSRNSDYKTGSLLDYSYHQIYYTLTGIDLSRQKNTTIPQQINFIRKLEE